MLISLADRRNLVPIYESEYHFIHQNGLDAFAEELERFEWSVSDPTRPSVVSHFGI